MDISAVETVKAELSKMNPAFKELVERHHQFEGRLTELAKLTYPTDQELLEEATLKKKKLQIKDEMYSMIEQYSDLH